MNPQDFESSKFPYHSKFWGFKIMGNQNLFFKNMFFTKIEIESRSWKSKLWGLQNHGDS